LDNGKPNGRFRIKSWADLLAIAGFLGVVMGGLAYVFRLEGDHAELRIELTRIKADVENLRADINLGILPRADERITGLEHRIAAIENDIRRLEDREN